MIRLRYSFRNRPPDVDKPVQIIINLTKLTYLVTHCILAVYGNQNYVTLFLCEYENVILVLLIKQFPAETCTVQGKLPTSTSTKHLVQHHQNRKDQQEIKDVPPERHADSMSSTQSSYLATYKSNNEIDIITHSICKH